MGAMDKKSFFGATEVDTISLHYASKLTNGGALAHIQLYDQVYTLRVTRAGKLIPK